MDFEVVAIDSFKDVTFGVFFDGVLVGSFPITMSSINYNPVKFKTIGVDNGALVNGFFSFANYNKYGYYLYLSSDFCGSSSYSDYVYIFKIMLF